MSEDLKLFIDTCLKNTKIMGMICETNNDLMLKASLDFTHDYILKMAKRFGYEENNKQNNKQ